MLPTRNTKIMYVEKRAKELFAITTTDVRKNVINPVETVKNWWKRLSPNVDTSRMFLVTLIPRNSLVKKNVAVLWIVVTDARHTVVMHAPPTVRFQSNISGPVVILKEYPVIKERRRFVLNLVMLF